MNKEDVYQLVFDRKWTYDTMYNMVKDVKSDLNGDSAYDENDMYGLGFEIGNYCNAFFMANDQPITVKGSDGYPELALNTPKTIDVFNRMYDLLFNNDGGNMSIQKPRKGLLGTCSSTDSFCLMPVSLTTLLIAGI